MPAVACGSAAASWAGSRKPRGAAIRQCWRRQQCRATCTARAVTLASEQRQRLRSDSGLSSDSGFRCSGAAPPAPPHPLPLTLTLTRPKHGRPQPGQGGQHPDPAHSRAQGVRVQAARHHPVPRTHRTVPSGRASGRASPVRLACAPRLGPPLGACPPGLAPPPSSLGASRGPAGIG